MLFFMSCLAALEQTFSIVEGIFSLTQFQSLYMFFYYFDSSITERLDPKIKVQEDFVAATLHFFNTQTQNSWAKISFFKLKQLVTFRTWCKSHSSLLTAAGDLGMWHCKPPTRSSFCYFCCKKLPDRCWFTSLMLFELLFFS